MDPILQRFGDVTIQRLEKPKDEANSDTEVSPLKRQSNSATTSQINKRFKYDSNILENELDNFSDFDSSSEEEPDELSESETDFFTEKGEEDEVGEEEENFDFDIKAKLKEMGEISFQTVKKGEKPKKNEITSENEVSVTATKKQSTSEEDRKGVNMRRNIREVMDETKLDETTLAAQRLEAERLRRVQEQQRLLRELQRQAERDRMQDKVISLLQGGASCSKNTNNSFLNSKNSIPNSILNSNTTRIGNTVLVKLPNGQTKPMTRLPKRPFDLVRLQKTPPQAPIKRSGSFNLSPSISIAPVGKKVEPNRMPITHSDSDSDGEGMKMASMEQNQKAKPKQVALPVPTIDISSDDDCIVVSEPEGDNDEPEEDPSNSGMHTNDEFNQPDEQGRVVVNVGHLDDEGDVFVAPQIARIIKPHQIGGVRFLYDNVIESTSRFENSSGFGCILAHSMGLGKTLQIVCFSDIFLRHTPAQTILCIMPINTLQNWMAEFNMWLPTEQGAAALQKSTDANYDVRPRNFNLHVLNDSHKTLMARSKVIRAWRTGGGVLLIGYEQFRLLSLKKHPKSRRKNAMAMGEDDKNKIMFDEIHTALVNPGPDLVICDEGHRIKNSHASISQALKQMLTKRRIVLTGYPLQNNLMEYWCMVDFVRPNYLGSKTEFCNMFERPIMNGQCIDSTQTDIKLMRYRAHVLHSLLVGFVQRRSHSVLQIALPKKHEFVLLVRMTPFQRTLYETFMNEVVRIQAVPNPLKAFAVCCKIWNHPDVLYNFLKKRAKGDAVDLDLEEVGGTRTKKVSNKCESDARKPEASVGPYFDNTTEGSCASINKLSAKMEDRKPEALVSPFPFGDFYEDKKKINIISDIKLPKINILSDIKIEPKKEEEDLKSEVKLERLVPVKDSKEDCGIPYDWAYELLQNYTPGCIENSAKMRILFCIVNESIALGDRLLVFSQSLITLDLIEQFLQNTHLPNNPTTNWARNFSYFRLDGSTSALEREKLINEFNSNKNIHLFLVSTRAGSLGINLIGANRVVVLDASWNPCHDTQAVCRVYRYGQKKPCYVYRLVVDNCLEKKIYDRQINKQGMSDRVVDECNPDAHLTLKDVSSLCWDEKYDDNAQEELDFTNAHAQCCDKVLQKVLSGHGTMLNKAPFQHESLLVDRKEKQLSQQEKRLAKKGYEREKQAAGGAAAARNAVRPIASVRPMQHGPNRWIPAEHWQRQGMTAQEMTLPLDVVIPTTNQPEKGNIVLKAGQKVLVLKSPKGVYMQLESGKIVAIKTAIKVKGELRKLPPPTRVVKPFQAKFNVKSIKQAVPNLDPVQSMRNIKKNSSSSSEEEEDQNSNLEKLARATSAAESSGFQVTLNSITQQQGDKVPEPETEFLPVDIKSEAPDYVNYNASSAGGYYNNYNYPPPPQQNYVYQQPQAAPPYEMMTYQHPAPPPQSQVPPIPPIYNNYNYQSYQTYAPPPPPPPQNYDYGPPPTQNIYHPPPVYHHNPYTQQPYAQVPPLQAPAAPPPQMYPQMPSAPQHYNTDYQYQPTPPSQIQPPPSLPQNVGSGYYSNA